MNVEQSMCAASGPAAQWEQIDWSQCEQKVRRLQARIVKATQEGRHGKVKALQWLLTHSFHGRALAVKRVTHNKGKNTPGVDGAIWSTPASRYKAIDTLRRRGYPPPPFRRKVTMGLAWQSQRGRFRCTGGRSSRQIARAGACAWSSAFLCEPRRPLLAEEALASPEL